MDKKEFVEQMVSLAVKTSISYIRQTGPGPRLWLLTPAGPGGGEPGCRAAVIDHVFLSCVVEACITFLPTGFNPSPVAAVGGVRCEPAMDAVCLCLS